MGEHIKMGPTCPGQLAPWESEGSCWSGGESCGTVQSWCTQVTPRRKFTPHFFPRALLGPVPVAAMGCGEAEGIFPHAQEMWGDPKGCEGCGFGSGSVGCTGAEVVRATGAAAGCSSPLGCGLLQTLWSRQWSQQIAPPLPLRSPSSRGDLGCQVPGACWWPSGFNEEPVATAGREGGVWAEPCARRHQAVEAKTLPA